MKSALIALTIGTMLTVDQRDAYRTGLDPPTSAVSADGRFVAFVTHAQLAPADADLASDVYVLDRVREQVTLESTDTHGYEGDTSSPGISSDGRLVVFEQGDAILLRDRLERTTTVVGEGRQPAISDNGAAVVFTAGGFNRAPDVDLNGANEDIYWVDVRSGLARRISLGLNGLEASQTVSVNPAASSDGRYVAFTSRLQLTGGRGGPPHVFVRDTVNNVTSAVGAGWDPSVSGDGRFVAFVRLSNQVPHIGLTDLETGRTRIITQSMRRGLANGASAKPAFASGGRFVVFQSEASDLVKGEDDNLLWDVFVYDRTTNAITRVSGDRDGAWMEPSLGPSIDANGSVITFSSRHPTHAADKSNDFDLYVASLDALSLSTPQRRGDAAGFPAKPF